VQFFVKTDRTQVLNLDSQATVADVKAAIEARQGIAAEDLSISFAGRILEGSIREGETIRVGVGDDGLSINGRVAEEV